MKSSSTHSRGIKNSPTHNRGVKNSSEYGSEKSNILITKTSGGIAIAGGLGGGLIVDSKNSKTNLVQCTPLIDA